MNLSVDGVAKILNSKDNQTITGSDGRDYITNTGAKATISGKGGNDTIVGSGNPELFQFAATDGNDLIKNFGKGDTLQITQGNISADTIGNDVVITAKSSNYTGTVTLKDAAQYVILQNGKKFTVSSVEKLTNTTDGVRFVGTSGADYIVNSGANVTVAASGGNDTIEGSNFGEVFAFAGSEGNDVILNFGTNDTLAITGGAITSTETNGDDVIVTVTQGNSTGTVTLKDAAGYTLQQVGNALVVNASNEIVNSNDAFKVNGTGNDDVIINSGENVTIQPNGGNDTIFGSDAYGEVFNFSANDGNNLIARFGTNDTLYMTNGNSMTASQAGENYIVTISGTNSNAIITLGGTGGYDIVQKDNYITFSEISYINNAEDRKKVTGTAGRDYITNSGDRVTIEAKGGSDTIEGSEFGEVFAFSSADGNNIITNFGKNDTLTCTAGSINSTTKSGDDVIVSLKGTKYTGTVTLQGAAGLALRQVGKSIFVDDINEIYNAKNKKKVTGTSGDDYITNTGSRVTIEAKGGSDTIEGSDTYGELFNFSSADGNNVILNFGANDTLKMTSGKSMTYEQAGSDLIVTLKGSKYTGTVTLKNVAQYNFVKEGNVLTAKEAPTPVVNSADGVRLGTSNDDYIINTGENVTIHGGAGDDTFEGSDEYGEVYEFSAGDGSDVITNFGKGDVLNIMSGEATGASVGNDYVINVSNDSYTGSVTLQGVAGNIKQRGNSFFYDGGVNQILNREDTVNVSGTALDDRIVNTGEKVTISGNGGNDTIVGSAYGEVFRFASDGGNDVITNFGINDTLAITGGRIKSAKADGNDYLVEVESSMYKGTVRLQNAAGYVFTTSDDSLGTYISVENVYHVINRDDKVKVVGTDKDDYIVNSGNRVTIQSGTGNDTIDGSNFGEVFAFASSDGNNVIKNFGANDTLRMTSGKTIAFETVGADVVVTLKGSTYTGTVTLENAAGMKFKTSGSKNNFLVVDSVNVTLNSGNKKKWTGTSGADYMTNSGSKVTIASGKGNDTIVGSDEYGEVFQFASNTGNNVITNAGYGGQPEVVQRDRRHRRCARFDERLDLERHGYAPRRGRLQLQEERQHFDRQHRQ